MADRISATTLSEAHLRNIVRSLISPRSENGAEGRFHALHAQIRQRENHLHNTKEADPILPAPHSGDTEAFQSDVLRREHLKMKQRLAENPYRIRVIPPKDRTSQRKESDKLEKVLQLGLELIEDRESINILKDLAEGMGTQCYGILHWQLATDIWPEVPDPSITGLSSEDTLKSDAHNKALAGFPFYVEIPRADQVAFVPDRSALNGMGMVVYMREVGMLEYRDKLQEEHLDIGTVSLNQHTKELRIYTEQTKPASFEPSGSRPDDWGKNFNIVQVWTRDEVYELVSGANDSTSKLTLVKSSTHGYEMPPFALAEAERTASPDPVRRYLPYMEGVFRLKPFVDYDMTVARHLAHSIAMPFYWIKLADGSFMDEGGNRVVLSHNSAAAQALPSGAELVKVEFEMNPAFVEFLNRTQDEMENAIPDTGNIDIGASTQPWTIRLAQEISNVPVADLKKNLAKCLKVMVRNMALVMQKPASEGGIGEPVGVYAKMPKSSGGKQIEEETLIAVDPEDIITMQVEVDIAPHSSAQTIAAQEHGRVLLNDPNVPYPTKSQYLTDFVHLAEPDAQLETWDAEQTYELRVKPTVISQELAKRFAAHIVLGPDGRAIGPGGAEMSPEQVLEVNGAQVQPPPTDPSVVQEGQNTLPLADLQVPGTTGTPGQPR